MIQVLLDDLDSALREHDEDRIEQCVLHTRRFSITLARKVVADLLNLIVENSACGKGTFNRTLELVRKGR